MADLSSQNPNTFTTLFINDRRAIRARYPDGIPETMGLHTSPTGYLSKYGQLWRVDGMYVCVWLVGMVSRRRVWLVGVGGIYGCG